uniref:Annexin n=1 Tax=Gadus morhua TaxID=8049 RepID=A0A8C5BNG7_GADMO
MLYPVSDLTSNRRKMSVWSSARGTVKASANFKMADDVSVLRKAMEGLGTTEKKLVDVLTQRSNAQRLLISDAYQKATGRALIDDLKSDTGGDFEDVLVALVTPPDVYDCREIISAIKGAGTTESVLTEMFASRTNKQIVAFKTGKALSHDLQSEVSGEYGKALILLSEYGLYHVHLRHFCTHVSLQILYEAGEKKWGTDESKFVDILCHSSVPQLRQTMVEYKSISKKSLQESIEGEMSGNLEDLLVAIVKCAKSTPTYLAERLFKGMKGPGTTESILTRIIVSRSELDLLDIRADYKKLFGTSLYSALTSEVSGDYGECLKRLCGGED